MGQQSAAGASDHLQDHLKRFINNQQPPTEPKGRLLEREPCESELQKDTEGKQKFSARPSTQDIGQTKPDLPEEAHFTLLNWLIRFFFQLLGIQAPSFDYDPETSHQLLLDYIAQQHLNQKFDQFMEAVLDQQSSEDKACAAAMRHWTPSSPLPPLPTVEPPKKSTCTIYLKTSIDLFSPKAFKQGLSDFAVVPYDQIDIQAIIVFETSLKVVVVLPVRASRIIKDHSQKSLEKASEFLGAKVIGVEV